MVSRLLPSALCIFLSPLLVAQQIVQQGTASTTQPVPPAQLPLQIALSPDAAIRIVSPGDVSIAKIKPGMTVRFVTDRDVIVNGVKVIPASTPIDGVVDKVIHASHFRNRSAQVFIQVTGSVPASTASILLRCSIPDTHQESSFSDSAFAISAVGILNTFAIVVLILMVLVLLSI
jgi:hypothetical protein